jgi:hypothetical protein
MPGWDDQFGRRRIEMGTPIGYNAIRTIGGVTSSSIADYRMVRRTNGEPVVDLK